MEHIIVNEQQNSGGGTIAQAKVLNRVIQGPHFNAFVESQKMGYKPDGTYKKKGLTDLGAANLREETEHILAHCNPHDAVSSIETTHLVVGYVQSGKTMSFTGLTALALDNHYRVIVYLAGSKNNLLDQTYKRLKKDLIGEGVNNRNVFKLHKSPKTEDINQIVGNLYQEDTILLIPVLKHYKHIKDLTTLFKHDEFINALGDETILIIDDEADQASLNSYGLKNSKKSEEEEEEMSKTYDAILKLRTALPGNSYIQYTATPQANVLISMNDMLSPKSHTLLTPGEGYIGGKLYFGKGKDHDLFHGRLIMEIPEKEVFHKKKNLLNRMPESLKDALILHILAVSIVVKYFHKDGIDYLSMMVHPATEKKHNSQFKKWIENQLKIWRKYIMKEDGNDDKVDMINRFKKQFAEAIRLYNQDDCPTFEEILPLIKEVLFSWKVYLVNTDKDAQTEIEWDDYKMHVLVGAEMLNRGFTVENLATTYMPRYSTGLSNADTIQQRCRFFGYKRDYIESCRVFLPARSIGEYIEYVSHEEELRVALKSCDTLEEARHMIMLQPNMHATRANVLPVSIVNSKLNGHKEFRAYENRQRIEANAHTARKFLQEHASDVDYIYDFGTDDRCHKRFKISVDDAIEFLTEFLFGNYKDAIRKSATIRYLRYLSSTELKDKAIQYVYFVQMAYKREGGELRVRSFDYQNSELLVPLASGRSPKGDNVYPGDIKIVGDETITIQLYHIKFKEKILDFPDDAYSIAINYPQKLTTNYVASEGGNQVDDEEDEDDE